MIGVSDDSTRFAEPGNYILPNPVPSGWKAWASRPRDIVFRTVFALEPSTNSIYTLQNYDTTNLNEIDPNGQMDTTLRVAQASVTVRKPPYLGKSVKVTFSEPSDVCTDDQHIVHGFFDLTLQVASSNPDRSGAVMLQMVKEPTQTLQIKQNEEPQEVEPSYVSNSLRSAVRNGKRVLTGEFALPIIKPLGKSKTFSAKPEAQHPCRNGGGTCVSLPLLGQAGPTMLSYDGTAVSSEPQMALSYSAQRMPGSYAKENSPESLKAFGTALPEGSSVLRQSKQQIRIQLAYVPLKNGHAALEEESGPTNDLNNALHGSNENRVRLFGAGLPFSIEEQRFTVHDETDQKNIAGGYAHLYPIGDSWQLDIEFPETPAGHLMRGDFNASVFDSFGDRLNIEEHTWNQALQIHKEGKSDEQLLSEIAALCGIDSEKLNAALKRAPAPGFPNTDFETARALSFRTRVRQVLSESDTLNFDEFTQLRNMATLFNSPH